MMVPQAIERIAEENRATIVRTRSDRRALRSLAASTEGTFDFVGGGNDEVLFPEFQPAYDGLYGAAKTMELLAREGRPLGELIDMLPEWHVAQDTVACPWERKGVVMRTLHDEYSTGGNGAVEVTDGLRMSRDGGWVLVLPDASDPLFTVYAEGSTDSTAHRYVDEMRSKIETLVSA
jgi:mannose-1-phosphate guanylyltransferase/phosphomannomutase